MKNIPLMQFPTMYIITCFLNCILKCCSISYSAFSSGRYKEYTKAMGNQLELWTSVAAHEVSLAL